MYWCIQIHHLEPLAANPSVEKVQRRLGLVHWHHVAGTEDLHECTRREMSVSMKDEVTLEGGDIQVSAVLDLSKLVTVIKLQVFDTGLVEILLPGPLKSFSPGRKSVV